MRSLWCIGLLVLAPSSGLAAQQPPPLFAARTLRCMFTVTATADMDKDTPVARVTPSTFELIFDQVDLKNGSARLIGNIGASDVMVIRGDNGLTFVEGTQSGVIQVTAVYTGALADGRFKAVASRHTGAFGMPIPSQAYGACRGLVQ